MKLRHTASKAGKRGHRWPFGFPSGVYVGRAQGFSWPSPLSRQAATMRRALQSFAFVRLGAPTFGAKQEA